MKTVTVFCDYCGKVIENAIDPTGSEEQYCSHKCLTAKKPGKYPFTLRCNVCGTEDDLTVIKISSENVGDSSFEVTGTSWPNKLRIFCNHCGNKIATE